LSTALGEFNADLIVYNAGTDCLIGDPLGALSITPEVFGIFLYKTQNVCLFGLTLQRVIQTAITLSHVMDDGRRRLTPKSREGDLAEKIRKSILDFTLK
jgi:hypothetical protein